ncbi:MAG: type II secretion system protein [Candidatus Paceibacterota bacterium]
MNKKGFTLIEALVAIAIVALAIGGPLYSASRSLVAAQLSRDRLVALYLAQEALEQARYLRDTAYLDAYKDGDTTGAWNKFLTDHLVPCYTPQVCTVEPASHTLRSYDESAALPKLSVNTATGQYVQAATGEPPSPFTRTLQVVNVSSEEGGPQDKELAATTAWTFHGTPYSVTVTSHLTAWQ